MLMKKGGVMDINHIFEQISPMQCRLVEITGGEPLIQEKTPILCGRSAGRRL